MPPNPGIRLYSPSLAPRTTGRPGSVRSGHARSALWAGAGAAVALLAAFFQIAGAGSKYPPGPPYRSCPDTLTLFDVQNPDTSAAPCHPATLDTVWGVRGIITGIDARSSSYSFYFQMQAGGPYSGVIAFTGNTNYNSSVPGTPTGGNLAVGDEVAVYGTTQEFPAANGETEIEGPDASQSTNDIIIRRLSTGNPLPPFKIGSTHDFNWVPGSPGNLGEEYEGCLVRIPGPLRVARTTGLGLFGNNWMLVSVASPTPDSIMIDGFTLCVPAVGIPAVGTVIDSVQGILNQRTSGSPAANSYRLQLRGADDMFLAAPPTMVEAHSIEDQRIRLVFDRGLDQATAETEGNYTLSSGSVVTATLASGSIVELDVSSPLGDGAVQSVTAQNIGSAVCPACLSAPQSIPFYNGVIAISQVQAPNPDSLGVCVDRSRYSGPSSGPGGPLTLRGVAVKAYGTLAYVVDPAGGPRSGIAVFAPTTPLTPGRQYRVTGRVQEFMGETELAFTTLITDEGPATVPDPVLETVAVLRNATCDASQSQVTGEDYEGMLVRIEHARVVAFNSAPQEPTPGGSFRVVQPPGSGAPDTIRIQGQGQYTFDADVGQVVSLAGILRFTGNEFRILPRNDGDISLIAQIQPSRGGDDGFLTAVIGGFGIQGGATARLARAGESDIAGGLTVVSGDGRRLTSTFDLNGKEHGLWDVIVSHADGRRDTLRDAFTIEAGIAPQIRISLVGPNAIRSNRRMGYDLVIENRGNVDAEAIPLWITGVPAAADFELDFPLDAPPQGGGEPDWSLVPASIPDGAVKHAALVIPRLPPGVNFRRIYLSAPPEVASFDLGATLAPPWSGAAFVACLSGAGAVTSPECVADELDGAITYVTGTAGLSAVNGYALWARIGWRCEGATDLAQALAKAELALDALLPAAGGAPAPPGCEDPLLPRWRDVLPVTVGTSLDPNDKLGDDGVGKDRLLPGRGVHPPYAIPYSIRFENREIATAAARTIVVTDNLAPEHVDFSTLSIGRIKIADRCIEPVPQIPFRGYYGHTFTGTGLRVDAVVHFDDLTGVLTWTFTTIDSVTGEEPTNPLVGFLPPNHDPPEGEGSVEFTVMPLASLANNTQIENLATIAFDEDSLETDPWTNTIDVVAPQSQVVSITDLPATTAFEVHWSSTDSDLRDFTIEVSRDGGPSSAWKVNTTTTSAIYPAEPGHEYAFYSVARDLVGNIEAAPSTPDISRSTVDVPGPAAVAFALEGVHPHPATSGLNVWFALPSREPAALELMDVAGRRVWRRDVGSLGPGRHGVEAGSGVRLHPGLYFIRLTQGSRSATARALVLR